MPDTTPAPGPGLDPALTQRVHAALRRVGEGETDPGTGSDYGDQTTAVLAELAPDLARAQQAERELAEEKRRQELYEETIVGRFNQQATDLARRAEQAEKSAQAIARTAREDRRRRREAEAALARVREARDRIANAKHDQADAIWCLDQLDTALTPPADPEETR
jgi:hypothetical protein